MNTTLRYGLTKIIIRPRKTVIYHGGNMGNTIDNSVRPNVDHMLGATGTFDELRAMAYSEEGGPDYMYTLTIPTKTYRAIVGV